ncbi:MAG: hypothetical protein J2P46_13015 [Zavarzinella sp.]|nr:hypothetical protein [Zavarzinella sp.]
MTRKLVFVLGVIAATGMASGCKEDKSTPSTGVPKSMYNQGPQSQYKAGAAGGATTSKTP